MKFALVLILALATGACAHAGAGAETASLTPDQIRAELAAISVEIGEISAASKEDYRVERMQTRMASFAQRSDPAFSASPAESRNKLVTTTVPYTRLRALQDRREQLLAQLEKAAALQN